MHAPLFTQSPPQCPYLSIAIDPELLDELLDRATVELPVELSVELSEELSEDNSEEEKKSPGLAHRSGSNSYIEVAIVLLLVLSVLI